MRASKWGVLTAVTCLAGAWCDEAALTSSAIPAWGREGPLDEQLLPEGQMGVSRGSSSLHSQHDGPPPGANRLQRCQNLGLGGILLLEVERTSEVNQSHL